MACRDRIKQYFSSIQLPAFSNIFKEIRFVSKYFFRFGSDNDFILRIAPLHDKKQDLYRNYFPPPLYGVPPDKLTGIEGETYAKYGLFLWPDSLYKDINRYTLLLLATLIPFIVLFLSGCSFESDNRLYYAIGLLSFLVVCTKVVFILLAKRSPPVLNKVWPMWPESQYSRFLTVPHLSDLDPQDEGKKAQKYWRPDETTPLSHQPAYYAKGKNSLQEVILHLSVFDFLFYSKDEISKGDKAKKSLKKHGWFYLLSPAIISYALLMIAFWVSTAFYPSSLGTGGTSTEIPVLFRLPFFYVPLVVSWSVLTFLMIMKQMRFLERLQNEVREGYYNAHLELIPQQILNVISDIPRDEQISKGIEEVGKMLRFVQAGALASYLMMLEIFASGFSV